MPFYTYKCNTCGLEKDFLKSMGESKTQLCTKCCYDPNINGDDEKFNADKMINIFRGEDNDFSIAVCFNAAAGLIVNETHQKFADAYNNAREHILSNKVIKHLEKIQNG